MSARFLVLDGLKIDGYRYNPVYRGTFRAGPAPYDAYGNDHPVNVAFRIYLESQDEGVLYDFEVARSVCDAFCEAGEQFEVVEALSDIASVHVGERLLGFDISLGLYFSLLSWGLQNIAFAPVPHHIDVLTSILYDLFRPQLNKYGLFNTRSVAERCLSAMKALQTIYPGLYENSLEAFEVVGLLHRHP